MRVIDTLTSIYPMAEAALQRVAMARGLDLNAEATTQLLNSKEYRLADADVKLWLSTAPDISQSGISFNLKDKACEGLLRQANAIYKEYGDPAYSGVRYGFKGSRL